MPVVRRALIPLASIRPVSCVFRFGSKGKLFGRPSRVYTPALFADAKAPPSASIWRSYGQRHNGQKEVTVRSPLPTEQDDTAGKARIYVPLTILFWILQFLRKHGGKISIASVVSLFWVYRSLTLESRIAKKFNKPSQGELGKHIGSFVSRKEVEDDIEKLCTMPLTYSLIWGENGVGKSSIVVKVVHDRLRKNGIPVFYIEATEKDFKGKLARELKFDISSELPERLIDLLGLSHLVYPEPTTEFLLRKLHGAAVTMKKRSGHRPVLIIDACNHLERTQEGAEFLRELQNWAKEEADFRGMHVVFVSSEGKAPRTLLGRGVSSRMEPLHIPEATDDEARQFLEVVRGVQDRKEQDRILKIAGGAFKYLSRSNTETVTSDISNNLDRLGLGNDPAFVSVSRTILEKGEISKNDFVAAFENREKGEAVLEGNVFFYDSSLRTVRFQNRATRNYMVKILAEEEAKRLAEEEAKRLVEAQGFISRVLKLFRL